MKEIKTKLITNKSITALFYKIAELGSKGYKVDGKIETVNNLHKCLLLKIC